MVDIIALILWGTLQIFVVVTVIWLLISYLTTAQQEFGNITKRWHHYFDGQSFSPREIYQSITEAVREKKVPDAVIIEHEYGQTYVFSDRRLYLKIIREDQMLLVCAAPFADGFFISWWSGERMSFIKDLIPRIPYIGEKLAKVMFAKTFYQMDTENMFMEVVKTCVLRIVDGLNTTQGIRPLSEAERKPIELASSKN